MTSYRKINITSEKIMNYRVISTSNHSCQIRILARERPEISVKIFCFAFMQISILHKHLNINISQ